MSVICSLTYLKEARYLEIQSSCYYPHSALGFCRQLVTGDQLLISCILPPA